jgi:hypothetical protein
MNLSGTQLKDTYGNLLTIGTSAGSPTTGTIENGDGQDITALDVNGSITTNGLTIDQTSNVVLDLNTTNSNGDITLNNVSYGVRLRTNSAGGFSVMPADTTFLNVALNGDVSFYDSTGSNPSLFWDASTARLGLGTNSPGTDLEVNGDGLTFRLDGTANTARGILLRNVGTATGEIKTDGNLDINIEDAGRTMRFLNGNTPRLVIDSSGNVGIGTASAEKRLHINDNTQANQAIRFGNPNATPYGEINYDASGSEHLYIRAKGTISGYGNIVFESGGSLNEAMRIDSSGAVGINNSSPNSFATSVSTSSSLVIGQGASGVSPGLTLWQGNSAQATINFASANTGAGQYEGRIRYTRDTGVMDFRTNGLDSVLVLNSSGNVGIGTSPSTKLDVKGTMSLQATNSTNKWLAYTYTDNTLRLNYNGAGNDEVTIDSSGNVLVGKTATSLTTVGVELKADGNLIATRAGVVTSLNREDSDGTIIDLRKDGTSVGSISSLGGERIAIHTGSVGIEFNPSNQVNPSSGSAPLDDTLDLGASGARWDDVYATNGTIQTSDVNEKQDIEELNDAELRVAQQAKTLLRKFRWKSSVAENENARIHFGIIAQDLEQAFTDEGLDAGRYGMFIKSTWTNEDGEEQTRLGVRYNQLLAFIISAI